MSEKTNLRQADTKVEVVGIVSENTLEESVRDGKKVIYTYSFIKPDITPGKFDTKLAMDAGRAQLCKAQQTMAMMKEGYVFVYRYKYMTGDVETVTFSKKEC